MAILPTKDGVLSVLILGRPNVGKSTLFNRLVRKRIAITDDIPHTTRDFLAQEINYKGRVFTLIDAAGFLDNPADTMQENIRLGLQQAVEEADLIVFLFDAETGPMPMDGDLLELLRRTRKEYIPVVNKIRGSGQLGEVADFYTLGVDKDILTISAQGGFGCRNLLGEIADCVDKLGFDEKHTSRKGEQVSLAVVGRPNVGKSTLINRLLGDERVLVDATAGTTRDAVDSNVEFEDVMFRLVDTAGIRRMAKKKDKVEEHSLAKAFAAVKRSDVVVLVIDAFEGATAQDIRIAGYAHDRGKGMILFLNKIDKLEVLGKTLRDRIADLRIEMKYLQYAPIIPGSALNDEDLSPVLVKAKNIARGRRQRIPTGRLNKMMEEAFEGRRFTKKGKEVKVLYVTQAEIEPPVFIVSVNTSDEPHFSLQRFIENQIREMADFDGTPIWLEFKTRDKKRDRKAKK